MFGTAVSTCASATDLRWECSLVVKQRLTKRLLMTLIDVCKPQHLFCVSWGEVQEGLIARKKGLVLTCDQQHTVPANHSAQLTPYICHKMLEFKVRLPWFCFPFYINFAGVDKQRTGMTEGSSDTQEVNLSEGLQSFSCNVLLPPSVELLDRTQLIKQLLVDESWHLQELVVGDKFIHDLPLHTFGLWERKGRGYTGGKAKVEVGEGVC